ncbi:MAG: histidine--tRNA ligase, partial [Bdellovibrionales bacterium]|nr:histidine--tRNA ligase [Bdellovibrionales bacterium]
MALSKAPYKGTRDFFPEQMRLRNYIFSKMAEVSELYAYEPYDGPMVEELDLYRAKSGEELINDQVYKFIDRGDREVAIRPEMTPTVARMVAQIHREVAKPLRWYSFPNLMRYEKPQKGRLREFWQYNADIFGAPEGLGDVEIIQLAVGIMKSFGANSSHFEILINDRRFVDSIFTEVLKCDETQKQRLYKLVDKSTKIPMDKVREEALLILQDADKVQKFQKYLDTKSFNDVKVWLANSENSLQSYLERLESLGLQEYVKFDPTIVRGLDYYTGVVFEIFDKHPDNRRAIAGGGAFANLLAIFGEQPLPGIGFGMGEVTLTDFLKTHNLLPDLSKQHIDILVAYMDTASEKTILELSQRLRDSKVKVEVYLGEAKPKKVFSYTDKKQPNFVLMLGADEIAGGELQLKNLKTKDVHKVSISDVDK